jgi:hypothetical protein
MNARHQPPIETSIAPSTNSSATFATSPTSSKLNPVFLSMLSVAIAMSSLVYLAWRNESTERNRNIRAAEFEMLKDLSELQQVVDYAQIRQDQSRGDPTRALTLVMQIRDLGEIASPNVAAAATKLQLAWVQQGENLGKNVEVSNNLSEEILSTRRVVIDSLRSLK